jgi:ActR/RegA family two-component response regulator
MNYSSHRQLAALIIDGDVPFCEELRKLLRGLDIELAIIESKAELLNQLRIVKPDFCFVELNLHAAGDAHSIIHEIRTSGIDMPLFVVALESQLEAASYAIEMGATDYFAKPLHLDVLEMKLTFHLKDLQAQLSGPLKRKYSSISGEPPAVRIEYISNLDGIDEFGVTFHSRHLFPKGTRVEISGPIVHEITGRDVVATSIMYNGISPTSRPYVYYAEFEDTSDDFMSVIRKWLVLRTTQARDEAA